MRAPISTFSGNCQQRAELPYIAALKKEVAKFKAERDIL
jgi:transposase